ncbi:hypothetical protein [Brachybacterium tyrofermentans]
MEYLGELGRLVPLRCASAERVQAAGRYRESVTVEGRRRVQVVPASPRTWDVSWDLAYAGEAAALSAFTTGAWGPGPWHWLPLQAHRGNLLTPREADLMEWTTRPELSAGGPVRDVDGAWTARSLLHSAASGWTSIFVGLPVIAGTPVTWSCDVTGSSPKTTMTFHDVSGAVLAEVTATGAGSGMQRVSVTGTPPSGAVTARVGVRSGVSRVARPQVSWTPQAVPWSRGHGCRAAVVDGLTDDLLYMADERVGAYTAHGFTVMEVS